MAAVVLDTGATLGAGAAQLLDDVVPAVRAAGLRLAVLSNAPASVEHVVCTSAWSEPFDLLVFSAVVGAARPDPAIYEAVEQGLGLPGEQPLFFDDRPVDVDVARQHLVAAGVLTG